MKVTLRFFFAAVFLMASTCAFCAPFLVSDPYPKKEKKLAKFLVTIDGKTSESAPAKNSEGALYLKYDLGNLPDGTYTASIKAVDSKGKESSPASYSFKKSGTKVEPFTPPVPKQKIPPSRSYQGHSGK